MDMEKLYREDVHSMYNVIVSYFNAKIGHGELLKILVSAPKFYNGTKRE